MDEIIQNDADAEFERLVAEREAKDARIAYAVKIGVLTPEIRAMPDGGRSLFDRDTWDKLHNFALLTPKKAKSRRRV